MSSRHRNFERTIGRESFALALAVPEVISHRVLRMWLAGNNPSRSDRLESHRMWVEKVVAFYESWNAMYLEMIRANVRFALSAVWWPWSVATRRRMPGRLAAHSQQTIAAVLGAGLAPVRRRAVANVKRLRRARR